MNIIDSVAPLDQLPSQAIGRIASSFHFVHETSSIEGFLDYLKEKKIDSPAFAVVDDAMRSLGVVDRKQLTTVLSRPFGREVLKKRPVRKISAKRPMFRVREHIFTVAEQLQRELKERDELLFLLVDEKERFCGLFSSIDLLGYLSELTQKDIALAHKVQGRIVRPRQSVLTSHLEVAASSTTAKGVGGDFYSVRRIAEGQWFITLCDVAGKGVAASIVTAMLHGSLETFDFHRHGLADFVRHVNRSLFETFVADKFLTGIFMLFNETSGELSLLDMGHSYFSLLRNRKLLRVSSSREHLPLGIHPEINCSPVRIRLKRRDILVLLTDGLTEQQNNSGSEYSMDRMLRLVARYQKEGVEAVRERICEDFDRFRGDAPYHDDVSFLIFRYPDAAEADMDLDPEHRIVWDLVP